MAPSETTSAGTAAGPGAARAARLRTIGLFLVTAVLFGTAFVGIKAGVTALPPVLFAALRFEIGAAILLPLVAARGGYWRPRTRADVVAVLVVATFLIGLNGGTLFVGQQYTTSGAAAIIFGLSPVIAPLIALALLPNERLAPLGAVGVLVGLVGLVVIVQPSPAALTGGTSAYGQSLVAIAATSVAFGSVLLRRIDPSMPSLALTAWAMAAGALGVHVGSLLLGEPRAASVAWTPALLGAVVYVGTFSTAGAFPAYFALIRRIGPIRANLVSYVVPIVATLTGWLVLAETVAPSTAVGFVIVVLGFALIQRDELRAEVVRLRERRRAGGRSAEDESD